MKFDKIIKKIYGGVTILCATLAFAGCEADITYEEAPEDVYSQVGISSITISGREWFKNQIYATNWNKWVENYIDTQNISKTADFKWTNRTGSPYTLNDGTVVAPDETVTVKCTRTEEPCEEAPDGKLYVFNMYAVDHAIYNTPNKGYLFDASKFSGDFELIDPVENRSQKVVLPVRKNELVGVISLTNYNYCDVEPVDGAPTMGVPADFTAKGQRYLVKNITHRPAGVEQHKRLYEIRLTFLPGRME